MKVHNGMIAALVSVNGWIRVQSDYEIVALLLSDFQEVQVSYMEEIECACHVYNLIIWLRTLAVAELYYFLRGRQKLRTASPWTPSSSILTHALARFSINAVFVVTLSKVLSRH